MTSTRTFRRVLACAALALTVAATSKLDARSDAPSRAVFPTRVATLHFSHARHADTPCATCHGDASSSARSRDDLTPKMDACATCHAEGASPKLNECSGCHVSYAPVVTGEVTAPTQWRAVSPAPMILKRPSPNLTFSHARHADTPCASCHGGSGGAPSMPLMQQCSTCHDGKAADSTCSSCHPGARGGPITTAFTDPSSGSTVKLTPSDHTVDWIARHGPISRTQPDACATCHVESSCTDCHQARGATPLSVHPPNYVSIHSVAARADQANCRDCHDNQTFCGSCHTRAEAVTQAPSRPPARRTFHPPGWLNSDHGPAARRNIDDCASCHQERDCVSCHQGINPHPPNYASTCAQWLEANPTPCLQCHIDTSGLCR